MCSGQYSSAQHSHRHAQLSHIIASQHHFMHVFAQFSHTVLWHSEQVRLSPSMAWAHTAHVGVVVLVSLVIFPPWFFMLSLTGRVALAWATRHPRKPDRHVGSRVVSALADTRVRHGARGRSGA